MTTGYNISCRTAEMQRRMSNQESRRAFANSVLAGALGIHHPACLIVN